MSDFKFFYMTLNDNFVVRCPPQEHLPQAAVQNGTGRVANRLPPVLCGRGYKQHRSAQTKGTKSSPAVLQPWQPGARLLEGKCF